MEDHDVPGAAGLFEQALCNGLAVIVEARWPGSEVDSKGRVKSAKVLLEVIAAEEARAGRIGPVLALEEPGAAPPVVGECIPYWDESESEPAVHVEIAVLREALRATAPRRHGKLSEKPLEVKHIDSLAKLDTHPALNSLHGEYGELSVAKEQVRDLWRRHQAENYLGMLSEAEIGRRVLAAQDLLPFDPKDRLISLGLQECPICDQESLLVEHLDDFGIGIGAGTCFVCGYYRSEAVVDEAAWQFTWLNRWKYE
ncbi:hypothetical protein SAMN05216266_101610 [Amycolatopsis marina]|uniref:Uncharacterized protein n=2 Tax=Amycolatopsis marina TaxID=490629 RepID=A0A1I0VZJ2_9PSEU|nr:hypothetical protein SAMN05216266_101610 [Amycolatopsis marina]